VIATFRNRRGAAILVAGIALALAIAQPHLARRWALYVISGSGSTAQARLFLDPFPDQVACDLRARDLAYAGGRGECRSALAFEWGSAIDRSLASDFSRTNLYLYDALCSLRGVAFGTQPAP